MNLAKKDAPDPWEGYHTKRSNHKIPGHIVPITPNHSLAESAIDPLLIECIIEKDGKVYTNWIGLNSFRGYSTDLGFCNRAISALKTLLATRYSMQTSQFVGLSDYRPDGTIQVSVKSKVSVPVGHLKEAEPVKRIARSENRATLLGPGKIIRDKDYVQQDDIIDI